MFKNVAFIDTETTGLDKKTQNIIELAMIIYDDMGERSDHLYRFSFDEEKAEKKALEINHYYDRKSDWDNTKPFSYYANEIDKLLYRKNLVGHNVYFDAGFLEKEFERAGYKRTSWRRLIDTYGIAVFLTENFSELKKHSMDNLRLFFNINNSEGKNHTAMKDTEDLLTLYNKLLRYKNSFIYRAYVKLKWKYKK